MTYKLIKYCCFSLCLFSCNEKKQETSSSVKPVTDPGILYAKRFSIATGPGYKVVYLFGNRHNMDTTSAFVLYKEKNKEQLPANLPSIQVPCRKIAALSSIYASMLCELGMAGSIAAIDNIDYVNNSSIISKFKKGELRQLAKTEKIDVEQSSRLNPDIIFTYGMGDGKDVDAKLAQTKIPVAVIVDHLEETPLARAEWIKFLAAFVDKSAQADSIFAAVENNYLQLKKTAAEKKERPTVFNEIKFGDTWYMPGGRSYVATLLMDAGADYLWKDDSSAGSLPLSFEQVYSKAHDADYWINLSTLQTKSELLQSEERYAAFKAYKTGRLYNNNKVVNANGYTLYWETGIAHPDRILSDLVTIFHQGDHPPEENDLYYYRQLK